MQNRNPVIAKVLNVLVFLFLYLPIAVLIIFSFNDSKSRTVWSGFSLHWYQELFQDEEILSAFSTTLMVSVLAALIATVFILRRCFTPTFSETELPPHEPQPSVSDGRSMKLYRSPMPP